MSIIYIKNQNGAANFENQYKNTQENIQDDESIITNKFIDNQSENQSEINYPQKLTNKLNINSPPFQKSSNLSNMNCDINYTDSKNLKSFNIDLNTNGKIIF